MAIVDSHIADIIFLGHIIPFLKNSENLLTFAREYFGNTRVPFSINLAGSTLYVISNPLDVSDVYNNTSSLSFDIFLHNIMSEFGTSHEAIHKIFHVPQHPSEGISSQPTKNVSKLAHDFQIQQTQGRELKILGGYIKDFFQENLFLETMSESCASAFIICRTDSESVVSLKAWTATIFINAGQKAYFGDRLLEIDPDLPQALVKLDDLSWQIFYQYPRFLRPELNKTSQRIRRALQSYFEVPEEERKGKAWFTQALECEYRRVGLSNEDIAAQMLFLYWGINTNVSKVSFWIIAHALFKPGLIDIIREETGSAFRSDGSLDGDYVYHSCPGLDGLWLEALRLSAASTALRTLTADTLIGGKLLRKGNKLMVSARQLHFDKTVFGEDCDQFDPRRFVRQPHLQRSASFRPFGGGPTLCPGRFLAKYMVLTFIALVFHRYDVELSGAQTFPKYGESKPAIGILTGDDDLQIRLRKRHIEI